MLRYGQSLDGSRGAVPLPIAYAVLQLLEMSKKESFSFNHKAPSTAVYHFFFNTAKCIWIGSGKPSLQILLYQNLTLVSRNSLSTLIKRYVPHCLLYSLISSRYSATVLTGANHFLEFSSCVVLQLRRFTDRLFIVNVGSNLASGAFFIARWKLDSLPINNHIAVMPVDTWRPTEVTNF